MQAGKSLSRFEVKVLGYDFVSLNACSRGCEAGGRQQEGLLSMRVRPDRAEIESIDKAVSSGLGCARRKACSAPLSLPPPRLPSTTYV